VGVLGDVSRGENGKKWKQIHEKIHKKAEKSKKKIIRGVVPGYLAMTP
jgi:hypothetical protein